MNRNRLKALAALAIPAAVLLAAPQGWAEPGGNMSGGPGKGQAGNMQARHQQMMQTLGMTPEQMERMKAIHEQGKGQSQALHQQLRTKRQALMQYMKSPDATEAQARSMNAELNAVQRQLGELRIKSWFQMRGILTPEQFQKMRQMRPARRHPQGQGSPDGHGRSGMMHGGGHFNIEPAGF